MNIEVLNPDNLTFADVAKNIENLFCIVPGTLHKYRMIPINDENLGCYDIKDPNNYILVKVSDSEPIIEEPEVKEEPKVLEVKPKRTRVAASRTYKLNSHDPTESIFVEFRPATGDIRVNFKDKESAQVYFKYFRDQFYTNTTGASVITVSNIYEDLNIVNWKPEDCDDWGWYTQDHGICRHITEVLKTKNSKMYGFTLIKPTKLYESKRREVH